MRQPTRQSWINNVDDLTLWLNLLQSFFSYRKRMNTTYLSHKRLLIKSNYFMEVIVAFYLASMHVNMQGTQKNSYKPHRATFTSTPFEWFDEDFVYVSLKGRSTRYRFESTQLEDFYVFGAKRIREVDEKSFLDRQVLCPNFRNEAKVHSGSGKSFL